MPLQVWKDKNGEYLPVRRSYGFRSERVNFDRTQVHWQYDNVCAETVGVLLKRKIKRLNNSPYDPIQDHPHPFDELPGIDCARHFISLAKEKRQHVVIYGDYDCDGVVSITLMRDLLQALGLRRSRIHELIPHRLRHGYGIFPDLLASKVRELDESSENVGLIIAVDCGTNDQKHFSDLLNEGYRVLVIDHHIPKPQAGLLNHERYTIINPKLWLEDQNPRRVSAAKATMHLCAAGLVYLLAAILANSAPKWNRDRALLLAGLATCADVVPLRGINRRLLKSSLHLANTPSRLSLVPGLFYMARRPASPDGKPLPEEVYYRIYEDTYGFDWGPALNAPGRMSTAYTALRLLAADDKATARKLVAECRKQNQWRQATTQTVFESALELARKKLSRKVLLVRHPEWHPGVVGIVASRLKEEFCRPTFVCGRKPTGDWTGSGRSIKAFHGENENPDERKPDSPYNMGDKLLEAQKKKWIVKGGGHLMAGGLSFLDKKKLRFQYWLDKNCGLTDEDLIPHVETPASASLLSPATWGKFFEEMAPFGQDNPCPPLLVRRAALVGVRPRARVQGGIKRLDFQDGYKLEGNTGRTPKPRPLWPALPELWAYEGQFRDVHTNRLFFAHWEDLEMAEYLWEISNYLHLRNESRHLTYRWEHDFQLELQLRSFTPSRVLADVKPGTEPARDYNFQILQCCPLEL